MSKTQAGTLHDVARISGLSIATISKYLNGVHVKAENKRKIEHAITECNYNVNFFARSLKTGFSMTIGVLVPNMASAFYSSLMAEIERTMAAKGYTLYVSGYDNNAAQENAKFRALISRKTDVILIAPEKLSEESLEMARANKIPVLFFDTALEDADVCAVVTDNRAVCRDVTLELFRRGFENIAVLAPGSLYSTTNDRCFGVRDAMEETGKNGVTIIPDLGSIANTYARTQKLLQENRPDAIFALSSGTFLGALMAVGEAGLRIPDDVAFIGYDNNQLSQTYTPRLSLVYQPLPEIAEAICEKLLAFAVGAECGGRVVVKSRVMYTDSIANRKK